MLHLNCNPEGKVFIVDHVFCHHCAIGIISRSRTNLYLSNQIPVGYRAVKCRLIWLFRGQALLLRVLHVVACDNVRDCVFLEDDLNRAKKGLNSYELNFSLPTNSQNKLTELN